MLVKEIIEKNKGIDVEVYKSIGGESNFHFDNLTSYFRKDKKDFCINNFFCLEFEAIDYKIMNKKTYMKNIVARGGVRKEDIDDRDILVILI